MGGKVPRLQIQLQWKPVKDKRDQKAFIWVWVIFWVRLKAFRLKTLRIKTVWRQPQLRLHLREKWRLQGDVCRTSSGGQDSGIMFPVTLEAAVVVLQESVKTVTRLS